MQQNCTAFMKTSIINEKIVIDVCYTRHGHEKEIQHIWLSSEKRRQIAAQINEGVSVDRILEDIREETLEEDIKRHQIVVKKDLDNIKRSFGLSDFKKHENDQESVRAWIEEWKNSDSNPILFHKFQGITNL